MQVQEILYKLCYYSEKKNITADTLSQKEDKKELLYQALIFISLLEANTSEIRKKKLLQKNYNVIKAKHSGLQEVIQKIKQKLN